MCGAPIVPAAPSAEYKQVTVLFADVVHSMDIAAAVGPERLREIMTELIERCAAVVKRYGGTVDKFTGDGIMAVFGAPVALEDHATRASMAALDIQDATRRVATGIEQRDGVTLQPSSASIPKSTGCWPPSLSIKCGSPHARNTHFGTR
jgi:adenylate cyclase